MAQVGQGEREGMATARVATTIQRMKLSTKSYIVVATLAVAMAVAFTLA